MPKCFFFFFSISFRHYAACLGKIKVYYISVTKLLQLQLTEICLNPVALRRAKTLWRFGCSKCNRDKIRAVYGQIHSFDMYHIMNIFMAFDWFYMFLSFLVMLG